MDIENRKNYEKLMKYFWLDKYKANKGRERHVVGRMDAPIIEYISDTQDIKDCFTEVIENAEVVIDYGCGIGRFQKFLKKHFRKYIGVDLVKKLPGKDTFYNVEDFLKLELKVDAIFTSVVLQHITDDQYLDILFEKFYDCLNMAGYIYLNEQVGDGSIVYRRKFPYINRRSRDKYISMLSKYNFILISEIPRDDHRIFKFKKVK